MFPVRVEVLTHNRTLLAAWVGVVGCRGLPMSCWDRLRFCMFACFLFPSSHVFFFNVFSTLWKQDSRTTRHFVEKLKSILLRQEFSLSLFSFSLKAVSLEDIITNLASQQSQLGAPFELYHFLWPPIDPQATGPPEARLLESSAKRAGATGLGLRICGVGDHLTATFDAVLMAETWE